MLGGYHGVIFVGGVDRRLKKKKGGFGMVDLIRS